MVSQSPSDTAALLNLAPREFRGPFTRWPRTADSVLAFSLLLATLFVWFQGPDDTPTLRSVNEIPLTAVILFAIGNAAIIWRRDFPIAAFIVVQGIPLLARLFGLEEFILFAAVVMLYSVGRYAEKDQWSFIAIACAVLLSGIGEFAKGESWPAIGGALLMPFLIWYLGRRLRTRGDYLKLLQDRALYLEQAQDFEARRAVAEERTRIARELHDVVAHRVSMMTVQAGAAKTVAADKPDEALKAMQAVEEAGREALDELRHILGVLRPSADGDELGPQPGLADIPLLVEKFQKAGLTINMKMDPAPTALPARVDLSIYRIAQEALTNVLKHAGPGTLTELTLSRDSEWIAINVTNQIGHDAPFPRSGYGIAGMRERAELLGDAMSIRVVVVDDQALVRGGFALVLGHQADIEVVAEAGDGHEAIEAARAHRPDVILMDIRMPNMDGLEATSKIIEEADWPVRVLILTTFDPDEFVYKALRAGASGFVLKDIPPEELVIAVRSVADGGALLAPSITRRFIGKFAERLAVDTKVSERLDRLTEREREVLAAIARGLNNIEISEELFIGAATVKSHVSSILSKLGLRDRAQAVVFAYESGLAKAGDHDIGY
eukprot:s1_g2568.t1